MKIFYFTSTGNSLYVAKKLGGEIHSIPKLLKEGKSMNFKADKIGIVFPCYYIGVPRLVKEFMDKVNLESDYIFAVMTYGNFSGGAVDMFGKIAEKKGISLSYLNEILMIDNYIPLFDMNEQIKKAPAKNIDEQIKNVIKDVKSSTMNIKTQGFLKKFISTMAVGYYNNSLKTADQRFTVEDSCNSCGICASVCPVGNIKMSGKPEFLHHCEECFACTHNCPKNSIRVKNERSTARWINEHIKTKDIVEANNTLKEKNKTTAKPAAKKAVKAAKPVTAKKSSVSAGKAAAKAPAKAVKKAAAKAPAKAVKKTAAKAPAGIKKAAVKKGAVKKSTGAVKRTAAKQVKKPEAVKSTKSVKAVKKTASKTVKKSSKK